MNKKKPLIALTPYFNTERDEPYMRPAFINAVRHAGGNPVLLPIDQPEEDLQQIVETFDGILLTGGPDVHPFLFGEEAQAHCGNVCLRRDKTELALIRLAMAAKKPILGVCRGAQILNISQGGDIYQDIPTQFSQEFPVCHDQPFYYDIPAHHVTVEPGTLLEKISGKSTLEVNSLHHQAVRKLAPGLVASGYGPGGLIECVEKSDYPFLIGVQWHPEYLWQNDEAAARLFGAFVEASAKQMK